MWERVDAYFAERLVRREPALDAALDAATKASREANLPDIAVSPAAGKLLWLLASTLGARRILEIGTLGGYSTIWLAHAAGPSGRVTTLEFDPRHADVARANLARAGFASTVEVLVGRALESLDRLLAAGGAPFDFVFVDADKPSNPEYLERALRLTRPGALIVVDNVVRGGEVANPASEDPSVRGVRRMADLVAANPRVQATALQTVGVKGYDGLAILRVMA
jgi:predicted O-methyltransferase YrrM